MSGSTVRPVLRFQAAGDTLGSGSDLEAFRVAQLSSVYYVPDYITSLQEAALLREVLARPQWTQLSGRRLQNYGGVVHKKGLLQAPLPAWLASLGQRLASDTGAFGAAGQLPNHVLVNAYQPGEGIMAHKDGPLYHPGVCILSLGAPTVIHFYRARVNHQGDGAAAEDLTGAKPVLSIAALPCSLLVFKDDAYHHCLHGIDEVLQDELDEGIVNLEACGLSRGEVLQRNRERISLTIRRVERTIKALIRQ